jgi:hypothetical protein
MTDLPATRDYGLGQSESQLAGMSLSGRRIWAKMRARRAPGWETRYSPLLAIFDGDRLGMFSDRIEQMKRDYTDKFVLVDATRPELARFRDVVGRVKTVNMSGRALVEFDDYHLNIGWYDIEPEFLKVVDKPPPKPPKAEAKKTAPAAKEKPAAKATAAPPGAKAGKLSVAEMMAAARGGGAAKPAAAAPAKAIAAPAPAAAKPAVDRSKMSVADMLAAARAGGAVGAAPAAKPAPNAPAAEPVASAPKAAPKAAAAASQSGEKVDKSKMSIDEMVAWCRAHDTH